MIISAHTPRTPLLALCHTLLLALLVCTLILPYPIAAAAAEITPDPAAPAGNRPSMDAASNGVPVVNIVAPVSSGLSHNMFLDFNVGTPGVIINNSNTPGISQLGGGVMGNPNFSGTQASTILNEVTSNRPSSIKGFTEIFGGKADYILANPNGVSINGGGFINTSRAVITTGTPQIAGGTLNSIEVRRGTVAVEGDGLNAQGADSFTILSRAATVAADLHAGQLNIIAGRNSYAPATQTATPLAEDPADGPAPVIAVDSSVLGGMYADRIVLVANEKGVGVNLQGAVNADHMTLHADGRLTFRQVQADTAADITAGSVDIAAGSTLVSRKDITVRADTIENAGLTYSGGSTTLLADSSLINRAGSIVAKGDLTLGDALTTAPGTVNVAITNEGGLVQSLEGNVGITAGTFLNKIALIDIQKKLLSTHYVPRFDGKDAVISYIGRTWGSRPGNARGLTETTYKYEEFVAEKSPTPQVLAGGNMVVDAAVITNDHGLIAAKKDMELRGGSLQNKGSSVSFIEHTDRTYYIYKAGSGGGSPSYATHDEYEAISSVPAVIAAGGTLSGDFTARIDNDTIKHNADYEGVVSSSDGPELPPGEAGGRVDTAVAGVGSLFTKATAPGRQYVLETNPLISSMGTFFGSEYFLSRMGWDLDAHHQKLLGDAFFETQMVRQQLAELNARSLTASFDQPDADMMIALMENALAAGTSLSLTVGIELTHEQLAALDKDIVWLVEQEYEGQTVLVPKVYLADASRATVVGNGARIAAKDVRLQTANLSSSGDITGTDVRITADEVQNLGGKLEGAALLVDASGTILNRSGAILGNDVTLRAGADVISETSKRTETFRAGSAEQLNQAATIAASDSLSIQAGNNIRIHAGQLAAGGDATLAAGKDVEIGAVGLGETLHTEEWQMQRVRQKGSNVAVGGDLTIAAGGEITVAGSSIHAGNDMALEAEGNIAIVATQDVYSSQTEYSSKKTFFGGGGSTQKSEFYVTNNAAEVTAGGNVSIKAGSGAAEQDVAILGSVVAANGNTDISATGGILIASVEDIREQHKTSSSKGFLSSSSSKSDSLTVSQVGSAVAGENVSLTARKDVTISASDVIADRDIAVQSQEGDVRVLAAQDRQYTYTETSKSSGGLWVHGGGIDVARATEAMSRSASESSVGSMLSAGNDITVQAANDATVVGSQLSAGNDIAITAGRDVNLVPGRESTKSETRSKTTTSGLSWKFSEDEVSVGGGVRSVEKGESLEGTYNQGSVVSAGNDVAITANRNINQVSSHVEAGNDVTMVAGENIHIAAAQDVEELDRFIREAEVGVKLAAKQNVTSTVRQLADLPSSMQAGKGSAAAKGITAVSSAIRAVSAVQGALSTSASASLTGGLSVTQTREHTETETPVTSTVYAGNNVALKADEDITIQGAQVYAGNDVALEAGRDLAIESATGGMRYSTDSVSASAGGGIKANVGANGGGVGANAYASLSGSGSDYESTYHRNAAVVAEQGLTTKSGRDTTVAGATVQGNTVTMQVGGDLTVASRQDESGGGSSSFGVSADVMVGAGASGSVSANVGKGQSSSAWVHEQTSIIGKEKVDIRVEDNTHVEGAVIAAMNGDLTLDTNTLTYADIHDHDTASNISVGVSVSGSYGEGGYSEKWTAAEVHNKLAGKSSAAGEEGGGTPSEAPSASPDDQKGKGFSAPDGSLSVDYSSKDRRQINRATIGEGTIIIRSDPDAALDGLNRDLSRAQEITKDEETFISAYLDANVLEMLDSAKELFKRLVSDGKLTEEQIHQDGINVVLSSLAYAEEYNKDGSINQSYLDNLNKMEEAGYVIVDAKDFDMSPFNNDKLGLASALFYNKEKKEFVLAFRGTEIEKNDLVTNWAQSIGLTGVSQYGNVEPQGITLLSNYIKEQGATLTVTGHSLGGGLATMVAASGVADRAVVFNPAGLHDNSIASIGGSKDVAEQMTTAYISKKDILNILQDLLCGAIPKVVGTRVYVDDAGLHGIDSMKKAFGIIP